MGHVPQLVPGRGLNTEQARQVWVGNTQLAESSERGKSPEHHPGAQHRLTPGRSQQPHNPTLLPRGFQPVAPITPSSPRCISQISPLCSKGQLRSSCWRCASPRYPFRLSPDAIHEMKLVTTKVVSSCHPTRSLGAARGTDNTCDITLQGF